MEIHMGTCLRIGVMILFASCAYAQSTLDEQFSTAGTMNNWVLCGIPQPVWLPSAQGKQGIFDNNGDGWYGSSGYSKTLVGSTSGFVLESEVYLQVTDLTGCWVQIRAGLTSETNPLDPGNSGDVQSVAAMQLNFYGDACWGAPQQYRRHSYLIPGILAEDGTYDGVNEFDINADQYANAWHIMKIVVQADRFVKFYMDDILVWSSSKKIHPSKMISRNVVLGDRSSGYGGKAYHNWVKVSLLNQPPVALCQNVTVPAGSSCSAEASIDNGSYDPDGDPITLAQTPAGPYPPGQTTVTLTVTDSKNASSQCTAVVTVVDQTAPVMTSSSPALLWPPNHEYQTFTLQQMIASIADNCSALQPSDGVITSATSDEPEDAQGGGDGNTLDDIVIAQDCKSVQLRSERMGSGNGRVYTIHLRATDASGNAAAAVWRASVPHDQNGSAVDDGPAYGVTSACAPAKQIREAAAPREPYVLHQNTPNPFNPSTQIAFTLPAPTRVLLRVFDALGRPMALLAEGEYPSGRHTVTWNGTAENGNPLPSGVYFYQLAVGGFTQTKKMFLIK